MIEEREIANWRYKKGTPDAKTASLYYLAAMPFTQANAHGKSPLAPLCQSGGGVGRAPDRRG
jgi:hypothetical protein